MTDTRWMKWALAGTAWLALGCGDDNVTPIADSGTDSATGTGTGSTGTEDLDCVAGNEGCECAPGGVCAPGLDCQGGVCECPIGTQGCPCTSPDRQCDLGLSCQFDLCQPGDPSCGNGLLEEQEQCDLGPDNADDGPCKSDCTLAVCGDGFIGPGEACDDGNAVDDDDCTNTCALPTCGDGVLHDGEECDDGNAVPTDDCLDTCLLPTCGDTVVWAGVEECDDGENGVQTDACLAGCIAATCGDSILWEGVESCDDGNTVDFDGCNSDCAETASIAWEDVYSGPVASGCDTAFGIHVDADDNVIAVGSVNSSPNPDHDCDIFVRKYDNDGLVLWTDLFDSPAGACDEAWGVETDTDGNIFVSGTVYDPTAQVLRDQWLRKYDESGAILWTTLFNGTDEDFSYGAAVDANGDVIYVGATQTNVNGYDATVRKLSGANASLIWERSYDGPSSLNDFAIDVETRGTDIYVVGFESVTGQSENAWIRRYDAGGNAQWTVTHNGAQNGQDRAGGVAIDSTGNVIVVGFERGVTNHDMWVAKYDPAGGLVWSDLYNNPDLLWADRLQDVAVDGQDNVVVVGHEWAIGGAGNGFDLWMRKYTPNGAEIWTRTENGPGDGDDFWYAVEIDSGDHPIVGGALSIPGQCTDLVVRKYNR